MTNILIILGSPTRGSHSAAIATFIKEVLIKDGHRAQPLNVRDLPPEALIHAQFNHQAIQEAKQLVEEADSIIVISPVFKASYPGILKSFFDLIPEKGLSDKKVLPIATAGTLAHLLSLEYTFKPLFSVLGAKEILQGVYIVDSQFSYSKNEITFTDLAVKQRLSEAVHHLTGDSMLSK